MHVTKGGCNGIGAWILNSVLNGAILVMFLNFYVKTKRKIKVNGGGGGGGDGDEDGEELVKGKGKDKKI